MTSHPTTEVATTPEEIRAMISRAVAHGLRVRVDFHGDTPVEGVPSGLGKNYFTFGRCANLGLHRIDDDVRRGLIKKWDEDGCAVCIPNECSPSRISVSVMGKECIDADGMDDLLLKSETTGVPVRVECMDGTHYIGAYDGSHLIDGHGIKWKVPAKLRSVCLLTMYPRTRRDRVASDVEGTMRLLWHCATHGLHATALVRRGEEFVEIQGLVTDSGKELKWGDLTLGEHRVSDLGIVVVKVYEHQPSLPREEEAMMRLLWRSEVEHLPVTAIRADGFIQTGIALETPSWWQIDGIPFLVQEEAGLEPLRLVSVVPASSCEQRPASSTSSCEPQLEGGYVDCMPPPVLQGGISSSVGAGGWNDDECFCPTALGHANPVCKTCNGTGFVSYETDTDDFSVLCHHCKGHRAQENTEATWELEEGGVLPCEDGVTFRHQWTAVRGPERLPFETHTGHRKDIPGYGRVAHGWHTWVSGWVAGNPVPVCGEQCHAMMAARVLAELRRTEGQ